MINFVAAAMLLTANLTDWHEYRSKHFVVQTNAPRAQVEPLIKNLEKLFGMELQALVGEQAEIPGRLYVVALNDPAQFEQMALEPKVPGYFYFSNLGEPTLVFPIAGFNAAPETVAHALAHHLMWFLYPRQPHWFSEGLAQFVQTVAVETGEDDTPTLGSGEQGGRGSVGFLPSDMKISSQWPKQVPAKELLSWAGRDDQKGLGGFHVWSWVLYHYLFNTQSKHLEAFQKRLANADDPTVAWREEFPDFDPRKPTALTKLDEALARYAKSKQYAFYRVNPEATATFKDQEISPAEVRMLLLDARRKWPKSKQEAAAIARNEVEAAFKGDPGNPIAIAARTQIPAAERLAALRKITVDQPQDWRAWFLLGTALSQPGQEAEQEVPLRKAAALNRDSGLAQNNLAWLLVTTQKAKDALPFANRAVELQPWNPTFLHTLALVASTLDKCSEALILERRAAALLTASPSKEDPIRKRLADYESQCGATAATPSRTQ